MTLPDERFRAVMRTADFLLELTDPQSTPRIPRAIRQRARSLLKHYPTYYHLERLSEKSPDVIIEKIEPLTKMVMQYDQEKKDVDAS